MVAKFIISIRQVKALLLLSINTVFENFFLLKYKKYQRIHLKYKVFSYHNQH